MSEREDGDVPIPLVLVGAFAVLLGVGWLSDKLHPEQSKAHAAAEAKADALQEAEAQARHAEQDRAAAADRAKRKSAEYLLKAEQNAWDVLADPPHARFYNVVEVEPNTGLRAYCGSVEALNTLGGRTSERFVAWWSGAAIESQGPKYQAAWDVVCKDKPVLRNVPGFGWAG
jgi:hypothetical protein